MHEVLKFLSDLKENNNKEWFDKNRERYEFSRKKVLLLTELVIHEIALFDAEIGNPDPKNCVFRIYRDVRFGLDKTPYKTNMGSYIARGGKKSIAAGYYLHIEPGNSFVGGGSYCPPAEALKAIRTEIFDRADEYLKITQAPSFIKTYPEMYDDRLKTAPKGFPKDFAHVDLLKYKSYAYTSKIEDEVVCSEDYANRVVAAMKELYPVNQFLNTALDKWL
jgi:uncharacterized protein (TIGR02453 family)